MFVVHPLVDHLHRLVDVLILYQQLLIQEIWGDYVALERIKRRLEAIELLLQCFHLHAELSNSLL